MTRPKFTPNQERCLAFDDNLCVLAGAGSGKTLTLVELVVRLLEGAVPGFEEPFSFKNILAITFTEKAAREMRDRVSGAINDRIRTATGDHRRYWIDRRRELDRAEISTIHSFCLNVLRRFGPELGLDPGFGILDEDRDFLPQVRRETLLNLLQDGNQDLIDLLDYFAWLGSGYAVGLDGLLDEIISHERTVGRNVRLPDTKRPPLEPCFDQIVRAGELVLDMNNAGDLTPGKEYTAKALSLAKLASSLDGQPENVWLENLYELTGLLKGNWFKAKPAKDAALDAVSIIQRELDRRAAQPVAERLLRLSQLMKQAETTAKLRRDKLDFDDLLLNTRDLLAQYPYVRGQLKERFRVVLVDEFQDTNRLQADIVAMLVEPEENNAAIDDVSGQSLMERLPKAPRRLVVFGDPKQSIYRFRGAEVSVFEGVRQSISQGRTDGVIPLDRNFRSQKRLIDFFNTFFPRVMGDGYGKDDRQTTHRPDLYKTPAVALLDTPEGENEQQERINEAESLARYITALLLDQLKVRVGEDAHSPRPDDIAVLLRRFTHLKAYEDALKQAGLPFYTVRGRGFYQCPEVWDLINLLFYLSDPANGPALLGVLRSPLAGLSDATITKLVWANDSERPRSLGAYFEPNPPETPILDPDQQILFQQVQALLISLTSDAGRSLPAELVENAVEETDYLAVLLSQAAGEQKVANVKRFIELTRSLPATSLYAPSELARYLKARLEDTRDDPEAQSRGQGIQIMTIHQAKGLQFPIVFVPDAGRGPGTRTSGIVFNVSDQLAIRFNDPSLDDLREPPEYAEFKAWHLREEYDEHIRLLYVAATRAQDHLVFSGNKEKAAKKQGSWLGDLVAFTKPDASTPKIYTHDDLSGLGTVHLDLETTDANGADDPELGRRAVERVLGQGSSRPDRISLPVTDLAIYLACPRQFYLERMVGLPRKVQKTREKEPSSGNGLTPQDKGNIFHGLMENLDVGNLPSPEALADSVIRIGQRFGKSLRLDDAWEISNQAKNFLKTDWGRELIRSQGNMEGREYEFFLQVEPAQAGGPRLTLTGEIDLFFVTSKGTLRVVDYKYSPVKDVERYAPQVKTYALALHRAGAARTIKAGLYFALPGVEQAVEIPLEPDWEKAFESELQQAAQGLSQIMDPHQPEPLPLAPCPHKDGCPYSYAC